ncbi:MAG: hypothetical protein AAFX85_07225 [Pseudomonadota bacterium]
MRQRRVRWAALVQATRALATFTLLGHSATGATVNAPAASPTTTPTVATPERHSQPLEVADSESFTVLTTRTLDADGAHSGHSAYRLIRDFGGPRSIESPDLYGVNHVGVEHIYEDTDGAVGPHFVFAIHRDIDRDRDRLHKADRQRNEIKAYDKSVRELKGFENETLRYTWKFKVNASMTVSKRFTHFFQLKAVGGQDSQPILTISGAKRRGEDGIEVRHSPGAGGTLLARQPWSVVAGEWVQVYCRATFAEAGDLRLIVRRLRDGEIVFDITVPALDLWRGETARHFVRPKWGIYRSVADLDNLRPEEETVRFANFEVSKVTPR